MTTLVGIEGDGRIIIGSDRLAASAHSRLGVINKQIVVNADTSEATCIAVAGPITSILALRAVLEEMEFPEWSTTEHIYSNMLVIHGVLREHHGLVVKEEDDDKWESSQFEALIGNRFGLWQMWSQREILQINVGAAGSGGEYALGAITACKIGGLVRTCEEMVNLALKTSAKLDNATGDKFDIWTSPKPDSK